jgi:xanthine dehydrogenase accessory factor
VSSGLFDTLAGALRADRPVALAEVVEGPAALVGCKLVVLGGGAIEVVGSLGDPGLDRAVAGDTLAALDAGRTGLRHYGPHGEARQDEVTVFVEAFAPPPRLIVFGAVDFTAALARVAVVLGYRVTVCDARATFATPARFPMAHEVVVAWPDRYLADVGDQLGEGDAICVLTHDPKFDVPAIVAALGTRVGYLGAMGSRRTTAERERRLRDAGVADTELARLMAPIGLDIGARTPEETAVAICAEIIAVRRRRVGTIGPLRDGSGPIHRATVPS